MVLTNAILTILNGLKTDGALEAVVYNSPSKTNVELDTTAHPAAVLYIFRDGSIDLSTGLVRELADVNVMFLDQQDELDFQGLNNELILDNMVNVSKEFISRIIEANVAEIIGDEITLKGIYDFNDKNTTGVSLQFRLRELQGHCL